MDDDGKKTAEMLHACKGVLAGAGWEHVSAIGAAVEREPGWYEAKVTAGDTATLGMMEVSIAPRAILVPPRHAKTLTALDLALGAREAMAHHLAEQFHRWPELVVLGPEREIAAGMLTAAIGLMTRHTTADFCSVLVVGVEAQGGHSQRTIVRLTLAAGECVAIVELDPEAPEGCDRLRFVVEPHVVPWSAAVRDWAKPSNRITPLDPDDTSGLRKAWRAEYQQQPIPLDKAAGTDLDAIAAQFKVGRYADEAELRGAQHATPVPPGEACAIHGCRTCPPDRKLHISKQQPVVRREDVEDLGRWIDANARGSDAPRLLAKIGKLAEQVGELRTERDAAVEQAAKSKREEASAVAHACSLVDQREELKDQLAELEARKQPLTDRDPLLHAVAAWSAACDQLIEPGPLTEEREAAITAARDQVVDIMAARGDCYGRRYFAAQDLGMLLYRTGRDRTAREDASRADFDRHHRVTGDDGVKLSRANWSHQVAAELERRAAARANPVACEGDDPDDVGADVPDQEPAIR